MGWVGLERQSTCATVVVCPLVFTLLSVESVGEFVLVNADVGESSAGTEGLTTGAWSLTTGLLGLADASI